MTEKPTKKLGKAQRVSRLRPPDKRDDDGRSNGIAQQGVKVGLWVNGARSAHKPVLAENSANDNASGLYPLERRDAHTQGLFLAVSSLPLGPRIAFVKRWAHELREMVFFTVDDPLQDVFILLRLMVGILAEAEEEGLPVGPVAWRNPWDDPFHVTWQVEAIASYLLSTPLLSVEAPNADLLQ